MSANRTESQDKKQTFEITDLGEIIVSYTERITRNPPQIIAGRTINEDTVEYTITNIEIEILGESKSIGLILSEKQRNFIKSCLNDD